MGRGGCHEAPGVQSCADRSKASFLSMRPAEQRSPQPTSLSSPRGTGDTDIGTGFCHPSQLECNAWETTEEKGSRGGTSETTTWLEPPLPDGTCHDLTTPKPPGTAGPTPEQTAQGGGGAGRTDLRIAEDTKPCQARGQAGTRCHPLSCRGTHQSHELPQGHQNPDSVPGVLPRGSPGSRGGFQQPHVHTPVYYFCSPKKSVAAGRETTA